MQTLLLFALSLCAGWLAHTSLRRVRWGNTLPGIRNVGTTGRVLRAGLCAISLTVGLVASQPLLIAVAGFTLYETLSGWCALNAVTGRNSCSR